MQTKKKRSRTVTWEDPFLVVQAAPGKTGLELLQEVFEGRLPPPPITQALGFIGVSVEVGKAVFEGEPDESVYNPIGVVHGGLAATLLDSAMGCAVHSMLAAGVGYTTLEIKVNFIRPLTASTGPVRCEANVIHMGGRTATAEGRLIDASGKLYAHATTTCMVLK